MIYFFNKEAIDLRTITTMGVTAKVTDSAIGYFGTGLKYALATLLRTGHKVTLIREGKRIEFTSNTEEIRGKEFGLIYMGHQALAFTIELGKNWTPKDAYRELACNARDEELGGVSNGRDPAADYGIETAIYDMGTIFKVEGPGIETAHEERDRLFLSTEPIHTGVCVEFHPHSTADLFYRGINVYDHSYWKSVFTYNFPAAAELRLTEDRTLSSDYGAKEIIKSAVLCCTDDDILETFLSAEPGFESNLDFSDGEPSEEFMDACERLHKAKAENLNASAWALTKKLREVGEEFARATLTKDQTRNLREALRTLSNIGIVLKRGDIFVAEGLGYANFKIREDRVVLALKAIDSDLLRLVRYLYNATQELAGIGIYGGENLDYLIEKVVELSSVQK